MNANEVKAMVAGYFRYKKQCPIIAFEASNRLKTFEGVPADLLVVTESRMLYEIEVKVSISDLKHDFKKRKHQSFVNRPSYLPVYKFYFAVPDDMAIKAKELCEDMYPYAGLLVVSKFPFNSAAIDFGVREIKPPVLLNRNPLTIKQMIYLIRAQSGTICRLARDKANIARGCKKLQADNEVLNKYMKLVGVKV